MTTDGARPMPGGPLAIDLLNTLWQTGNGPFDWLDDDDAVIDFAAEHHCDVQVGAVSDVRAALVESRDLTRRFLESATKESATSTVDLTDEVNGALGSARAVVVAGDDGPTLKVTGDQPHNQLAIEALVSAVELLRDRADRVRSCEHEDCVLWFLDTSKSGRRRWCSMDTCGNRAKARRHYQRSTQSND